MKYLIVLFSLAFFGTCFASDTVNDLDVAISVAQKEQKNVLLIFTLDNCTPCNDLKNNISKLKYVDNYVVCLLNTRSHKRLAGKYSLKKWPTSIVLCVSKENCGEASRKIGFDKTEYEKWLNANALVYSQHKCNCPLDCKCRVDGKCQCKNGCKCECCNE